MLARWDLTDRTTAFHDVHKPESMAAAGEARRRLVFDELLRVQLKLVQRKRELERTTPGIRHDLGGELVRRFHERLPFPLTGAQRRVIDEIEQDLAGPHPMHRLLQGDVGAGKTIVAVSALLVAVQGGHQGALMAPTEVLAEQHFLGVRDLLDGFTVPDTNPDSLFGGAGMERQLRVELLTSRTTAAERRRILAGLAAGEIDLAIGTHALIQEGIEFRSLGVVVIDEQHRFGVEQRAALRDKSAGEAVPDVLVMTATPIPRTAAMTVYGDLDVSVLDEMPPGRTPIVTTWAKGRGRGGRRLGAGAGPGARGTAGLRGVPAHRGEREARGALGRGDLRAAAGGRAGRAAARAAARPGHPGGEGEGDGPLPFGRARRAGRHHRDRGRVSTCPTRR